MIDSEQHPTLAADPAAIRHVLAEQIRQAVAGTNGRYSNGAGEQRIVRLVFSVATMHPLAWLHAQDSVSKVYWSGRGDEQETAGIGVADVCQRAAPAGLEALRRHLGPALRTCDSGVRYYGGMRFDPDEATEASWNAFGAFRFVLPRFELRRRGDQARLYTHLVLPRDRDRLNDILHAAEQLRFPIDGLPFDVPMPDARVDVPGAEGWRRTIQWALDAFARTELDKVVFARRATFQFSEPVDAPALLAKLQAGTPNCYHYLFQPEEGRAFVGASPERLFRRQGRHVETEAVAGTRPRGASARDDARLLEELLRSEKDQREHEYVRRSIRDELAPLAASFELEETPSEMKLASGRHLVSRARAVLADGVTSLDVLAALHPTPAVGGYPTTPALAAIRAHEPFDRGWYAGPVGWIGPDAAEFAVGIRSGLVESRQLSLYSGAGIVEGSEPDAEWQEIECKLEDFLKVLGLSVSHVQG